MPNKAQIPTETNKAQTKKMIEHSYKKNSTLKLELYI